MNLHHNIHQNVVTWISWCLQSLATQLFHYQLAQANIKDNIKVQHYCPFANLPFTIHHRIPHTKGQQYRKGCCVMVSSWSSDVKTTDHCAIVVHMHICHTVAHNNTLKWLHICGNGMVTSHSGWLPLHQGTKTIWWVQTLSQQHLLEAELRIHQC